MTGPEHYKEAERLLAFVAQQKKKLTGQTAPTNEVIARMSALNAEMNEAQVHATLALAAATIAGNNDAWREALGGGR